MVWDPTTKSNRTDVAERITKELENSRILSKVGVSSLVVCFNPDGSLSVLKNEYQRDVAGLLSENFLSFLVHAIGKFTNIEVFDYVIKKELYDAIKKIIEKYQVT